MNQSNRTLETTMNDRLTLAELDGLVAAHTAWRAGRTVNLNAATNTLSPRARAALASSLADKGISSGLRHRHHFGGEFADRIEAATQRIAAELLHADAVDLRPMSGSVANAMVLAGADPARPIVVGDGTGLGHSSFGAAGWGGRLSAGVLALPFAEDGVRIDLAALEELVLRHGPGVIVLGSQAMLFALDVAGVRAVADRVGATVVYDAAHPLGLIAGGRFQDPLGEGADLLTASTQKSLPGPVGGLIAARTAADLEPLYLAGNALLSNYQNNRVLSLGYTLLETAEFGRDYAEACVRDARSLAAALAERGLTPLHAERGFTDSNQFLLPWPSREAAGEFAARCERQNVIVSSVRLPGPVERWGSRIGVQDLTRCGLTEELLARVADLVRDIAAGRDGADRAAELAARLSTPGYCYPG
jgi:glycine hydroxymethyltransferase